MFSTTRECIDKREFNDNGLEGTRCTVVVTFENNDGTNEVVEATAEKLKAAELPVRRMLFVSVEFTITKALLRLREASDCLDMWLVESSCRSEGCDDTALVACEGNAIPVDCCTKREDEEINFTV